LGQCAAGEASPLPGALSATPSRIRTSLDGKIKTTPPVASSGAALIDNDGSFWSELPQLSRDALLPADDQLLHWFKENTHLALDDDGVAHLLKSAA
jgi:hypothetical protein